MDQKYIVQSVSTRWNSIFLMIERIIYNFEPLNFLMSKNPKYKHLVISSEELSVLNESLEVLEPIYNITNKSSTDQPLSAGLIIPSILILKQVTHIDPETDEENFKTSFKYLIRHFVDFYCHKFNLLNDKHLIISTFLHPRYKRFSKAGSESSIYIKKAEEFLKESLPEIKQRLEKKNTNQVSIEKENKKSFNMSDSSDEDNGQEINWRALKKEILVYMNEQKASDCVEFWKQNSNKYPILYEFFLVYGGAAASSSPSERVFSSTGYQVWDRRNKISPERVENVMFLYENESLINE